MTPNRLLVVGRGIAIVVAIAALSVGASALRPRRSDEAPVASRQPAHEPSRGGRRDSLDQLVVARDPFRPSRRPSGVAYDPNPAPSAPTEPAPPKPALVLSGIVWGAAPSAVLEGIPGVEGARLVKAGEVLGGFRIRRITAQRVTVSGMDTTWVLEVRKPW